MPYNQQGDSTHKLNSPSHIIENSIHALTQADLVKGEVSSVHNTQTRSVKISFKANSKYKLKSSANSQTQSNSNFKFKSTLKATTSSNNLKHNKHYNKEKYNAKASTESSTKTKVVRKQASETVTRSTKSLEAPSTSSSIDLSNSEAGCSQHNVTHPVTSHKYLLRSQGKLSADQTIALQRIRRATEKRKTREFRELGASSSQQTTREENESSRLTRSGAVLRRSTRNKGSYQVI